MHRFLIVVCSLALPLSDQNLISDTNLNGSFLNSSNTERFDFYRCPRNLGNKPNKPMACSRLHATEDTPFIAIILNQASGKLICMGSIIDEKHVLTAYKCIQNISPTTLRILIGFFKAYWGHHSQVLYVERIFKHEHELVLLRLKRAIVFSRTVKAIRLLRLEDGKKDDKKEGPASASKRSQPPLTVSNNKSVPVAKNPESLGRKRRQNVAMKENTESEASKAIEYESVKNSETEPKNSAYLAIDGSKENEVSVSHPNLKFQDEKILAVFNISRIDLKQKILTSKENFSAFDSAETEFDGSKIIEKRLLYGVETLNDTADVKTVDKNERKEGVKTDGDRAKGDNQEGDKAKGGNQEVRAEVKPEKKEEPSPKGFTETHPDIQEFLIVGFPLSNLDAVGDSISKTLVYSMKQEKIGKNGLECLKIYQDKPALKPEDDPAAANRVFCTDGSSKFCWGCLGGPTLYKKDQEYIQAGVVGGTNCDKDENYMHIRVDINMKWITANSLVPDN